MSGLTVRWTKRALRRLDEIGGHIQADDPAAAAHVIARIASAVDHLTAHPSLGRPGRLRNTREMVLTDIPYIIPYRVNRSCIEILTVMHGAQNGPKVL